MGKTCAEYSNDAGIGNEVGESDVRACSKDIERRVEISDGVKGVLAEEEVSAGVEMDRSSIVESRCGELGVDRDGPANDEGADGGGASPWLGVGKRNEGIFGFAPSSHRLRGCEWRFDVLRRMATY